MNNFLEVSDIIDFNQPLPEVVEALRLYKTYDEMIGNSPDVQIA